MRKRAIILGIASAGLISCFSSHAVSGDRRELLVWAMGHEGTVIREMARRFEDENPEVKVITQAIPWSAAHEKLLTCVVGGVPPDVSQMGTTWVAEFQSMGALEPLNRYMEESEFNSGDFFESTFDIGYIEGKNYGVPWYIDTRVLFYRKDLLEEAGYDLPPETWDEFLEAAIRLSGETPEGRSRYGIALPVADWQMFLVTLWQNGGEILDVETLEIFVEDLEFHGAVDFYREFFEQGAAPLEDPGHELLWAFSRGIYPMFVSGPWMIDQIRRQLPELEGRWGVGKLPGRKTRTSFVGGSHLTVFRDAENKDDAWKFIEFMSRPENQIQWFEISGGLPASIRAWETGYFDDKPEVSVFGRQMFDTKSPPNIPEWEEVATRIDQRLEEVIRGGRPVPEAQELLRGDIQRILARRLEEGDARVILWMILISVVAFAVLVAYIRGVRIKRFLPVKTPEKETEYDIMREPPGGMASRGLQRFLIPYFFILPAVLTLTVFLFLPIFGSFLISLTNWNIYTFSELSNLRFTGLSNYMDLLNDRIFWQALRNTFVFSLVGIPLNVTISLFVAVMIDKKYISHKSFFRAGYFMPVITTLVAVAVVWMWLYNPEYGLVNYLLERLGIPPQRWLSNPSLALPSLIIMSVWKNFGTNMIIILAGLQTIPASLYEAASVDGADAWQSFWNITLPSLKPTLFFVIVMTTIGSFQFFDEPYIMTDGGPLNSTLSMILLMYRQGFDNFNFGYGSAIGYVLFLCIVGFTLIQLYGRKRLQER